MSQETLYRIKVRSRISLRPGWISGDILPLEETPGIVSLGPHVPTELPFDMLPPDLRVIGSIFWMIFNVRREPVNFEYLDAAT